jgi:tRNA 2-thiouridine synthesizing protein A
LDALQPGEILGVLLRGEEPKRNVPATARQLGHEVIAEEPGPYERLRVVIRKRSSS